MIDINQILNGGMTDGEVINILRQKSVEVKSWEAIIKDYEPKLHKIVNDHISRKDKVSKGRKEEASRIHIGFEKLITKRMSEFTYTIPVKRNYLNIGDDQVKQDITKAIELIFKKARINALNLVRGKEYFAACEICSVWYAIEQPNSSYGFKSKYKLRCVNFSPMSGVRLYPLFDEYGDMIAMSLEYERKVTNERVQFFETYTADRHIKWTITSGNMKREMDEKILLGKIPAVYAYRKEPVFDGIEHLREEIEYALSRNSDTIVYNSAPILKVAGAIEGEEDKGESKRIVRVQNGGDVQYVSWSQGSSALHEHISELKSLIFMGTQMPDVSFEKMAALGNIGYDARKTLLTDAHLKVGDESGTLLEFHDREFNVVKAFLKLMRPDWADAIDEIEADTIITPFVQRDETQDAQRLMTLNGGKPVISQEDSIRMAGYSGDAAATLEKINKENAEAQKSQIEALMGEQAM